MPKRRRRREGPPEIPRSMPAEQLPWLADVEVLDAGPEKVILRLGPVTTEVQPDGSVEPAFQSPQLAHVHMKLDTPLSLELQERRIQMTEEGWLQWLSHWAEPPPAVSFREGRAVRQWPVTGARPPRRMGVHGMGDTIEWGRPFFKGSRFRFAHFVEPDAGEGAVIEWFGNGAFSLPWAYRGDFTEFIADQNFEDPVAPDEWRELNDELANGLMWALEKMGSFDRPGLLRPEVVEAIRDDSEALLEESTRKILDRLWEHPQELQEAALDWAFGRGLKKDVLEAIEAGARAAGAEGTARELRRLIEEMGPSMGSSRSQLGAVEGWVVTHDGETLKTFPDQFAAIAWLHRRHSYSVDHAVRYEGYDIVFVRGGKVEWSYRRDSPVLRESTVPEAPETAAKRFENAVREAFVEVYGSPRDPETVETTVVSSFSERGRGLGWVKEADPRVVIVLTEHAWISDPWASQEDQDNWNRAMAILRGRGWGHVWWDSINPGVQIVIKEKT